jgi:hypothetical protein
MPSFPRNLFGPVITAHYEVMSGQPMDQNRSLWEKRFLNITMD